MKRFGIAATMCGLTGLFGCDGEIRTIDRTQPNAIDKQMFEGIWYFRATIVEADPESGANEGIASNMDKLRWDIQEDLLIGYRSYEFVPFGEGMTDEGNDFFGSPVVAFPIESHFDIIRDYNPVTGVSGNVITENTTDRPWHQRRYMRVDWSQNMVGTPTLFGWGSLNGILSGFANSQFFVQGDQPDNPDRPYFTENYFDVTNMYSMSPSPMYCQMQLLFQTVPRCGTANVKTRLSFRRVDPTDDYESLYYPDYVEYTDDEDNPILLDNDERPCLDITSPGSCFVRGYPYDAKFGNFRTMRVAFDKERFLTRSGRIFLAGRFDIWNQTFDESGALIPFEQRDPKPIVYWERPTTPENIHQASLDMAEAWSEPFDETVAFLKGYTQNEGKLPDLQAFYEDHPEVGRPSEGGGMFQVRRNACNADDIVAYAEERNLISVIDRVAGGPEGITRGNIENVCAAIQFEQLQRGAVLDPELAERTGRELAFTWQRLGDLRFNFNNYVIQYQPRGPWGVAQFGQDPETGEYVANIANYFSDAGDFISQRSVDHIQFVNGDLDPQDLLRGVVTRDTVVSRRTAAYGIRDDIKNAIGQDVKSAASGQSGVGGTPVNSGGSSGSGVGDFTPPVDLGSPVTDAEKYATMFAGTQLEREYLITSDMLRAFTGPTVQMPIDDEGHTAPFAGIGGALAGIRGQGLPSFDAVSQPAGIPDEAYEAASPLNWAFDLSNNPYEVAVREFGSAGFDMADFFDPNVSGLAEEWKGRSRQEMFEDLQEGLYRAVQGHEVGHTLGLRHNFRASMDPLNYRPEFWELYWNNRSRPENPNRSSEYQYASIMDYGFDFTINGWHGLGSYDKAAIRFMYGQLVEAWDPAQITMPDPRRYGSFVEQCGVGWDMQDFLGFNLDPEDLVRLYAQDTPAGCESLPPGFDYDAEGADSCDTYLDRGVREFAASFEEFQDRTGWENVCSPNSFPDDYNQLFDRVEEFGTEPGQDVTGGAENIYGARMLTTVQQMIDQDLATFDQRADFDFSQFVYEVPYEYCSDRFAGFSNPFCQRWDAGWDFTESVVNNVFRYDRDYIFDHFQMDRSWFGTNPFSYVNRLLFRRFKVMNDVYQYFVFTSNSSLDSPRYDDFEEAAYRGLNFLERVLQEPEPGTYCLGDDNVYRLQVDPTAPCNDPYEVGIGFGEGRFLDNKWNQEDNFNVTVLGQFWDKLAATFLMTRSSGFFVFDLSQLFDRRAFALPYLRTFQDAMLQRFSSMIRDDHQGYRPRIAPEDPSNPDGPKMVRYTPFFDETFGPEAPDEFVGRSVRQWLRCGNPDGASDPVLCDGNGAPWPEIEPAWSYTLRLYALSFALSNWSNTADFAVDYYRLTNLSLPGTPGDIDFTGVPEVRFIDPETELEYKAPRVEPFTVNSLLPLISRSYYGNRADRGRGLFHEWSVGAELLEDLQDYKENVYEPALQACINSAPGVEPALAITPECTELEGIRSEMADRTGFLNIVRKFTDAAEGIFFR